MFADLRPRAIFLAIVAVLSTLAACDGRLPPIKFTRLGAETPPADFLGLIVGDEPQATLAGQTVLRAGGNAADSAVAIAFGLAVTLPSRAGMDSGGACLVYNSDKRAAEALRFQPSTLVQGLSALHARYGRMNWGEAVAPVEAMARFGVRVSRAFSNDLTQGGGTLLKDGSALGLFLNERRAILTEGETWTQPDLAAFLAIVRLKGPDAQPAGTPPRWQAAGRATSAETDMFTLLPQEQGARKLETDRSGQSSFVVADRDGNVVSCILNMGRMFGDARIVGEQGYLKAVAEASVLSDVTAVIQRSTYDRLTMAAVAGTPGVVQRALQSGVLERANGWRCANGLLSAPDTCEVSVAYPGEGYGLMVVPDRPM